MEKVDIASQAQDQADRARWHGLILIGAAVFFGAVILLAAAMEEPFHIDELRQTGSYSRSLTAVVDASYAQEQPPLDALINAAAQRVIGVGDVRQRLASVGLGVGSLVLLASLGLRSGMSHVGATAAVAVLAFTPLQIGVTAYARPYALPIFLMLGFLLAADKWIATGKKAYLILAVFAALLLPLSRAVEPIIFLLAVAFWLVLVAWQRRRQEPPRRRMAIVGAAAGGLLFVALPVYRQIQGALEDRVVEGLSPARSLSRLASELPSVLGEGLPFWPIVVGLLILTVAMPKSRRLLVRAWWWWPLAVTAIGFALAFFLLTPPFQPFFERYLFTWVPPLAVLVGFAVSSLSAGSKSTAVGLATAGLTVSLLAWALLGTAVDLATPDRADWREVSAVITRDLARSTGVVYDDVQSFGAYRTAFAGYPRYTGDDSPPIPLTLELVRDPGRASPGHNVAIVLLAEERLMVDGWNAVRVDDFFTVYLPETPYPGLEGMALAAEEFGDALGPDRGAAMTLAAASIWAESGNIDTARAMVEKLLLVDGLEARVLDTIRGTHLEEFMSS